MSSSVSNSATAMLRPVSGSMSMRKPLAGTPSGGPEAALSLISPAARRRASPWPPSHLATRAYMCALPVGRCGKPRPADAVRSSREKRSGRPEPSRAISPPRPSSATEAAQERTQKKVRPGTSGAGRDQVYARRRCDTRLRPRAAPLGTHRVGAVEREDAGQDALRAGRIGGRLAHVPERPGLLGLGARGLAEEVDGRGGEVADEHVEDVVDDIVGQGGQLRLLEDELPVGDEREQLAEGEHEAQVSLLGSG